MRMEIQIDPFSLRKRPRSSSSSTRQLYITIEALYTRIMILEDCIDRSVLEKLGGRFCGLEQITRYPQTRPSRAIQPFRCPGVHCNRRYERLDTLHSHIRKTRGIEHRFAKEIIDRAYCIQCDKHVAGGKALFLHDNASHEGQYATRLDSFAPYFDNPLQPEPESKARSRDRSESNISSRGESVSTSNRQTLTTGQDVQTDDDGPQVAGENHGSSAGVHNNQAEPRLSQPAPPEVVHSDPVQATGNDQYPSGDAALDASTNPYGFEYDWPQSASNSNSNAFVTNQIQSWTDDYALGDGNWMVPYDIQTFIDNLNGLSSGE